VLELCALNFGALNLVLCKRIEAVLPRSGNDPEPRVASTLGSRGAIVINRNAVASGDEVLGERFSHHGAPWDATALRLQNDWFVVDPGLKQPCVLRGKRFAVKTTWIQSTKDKALSTKH